MEIAKGVTCGDSAAGGVEVHVDGFGWVLGLEEEELGNDDMGGVVGDGPVDAHDSLFKEAREDVVGTLAPRRVLYHHRDQAIPAHCPVGPRCGYPVRKESGVRN